MVVKGQFLERSTLITTSGGLVLEGLAHRGALKVGLLVVPPLPEEGGMDHVVAAELAYAASREGHPTLRFNYRGVGASQAGAPDHRADVLAALELSAENTDGLVVVAAIGGSSSIVLALRDERVAGLVLVSPNELPASIVTASWLEVVLPEHGSDPRAWSAAVGAAGRVSVVPQSDRRWHRNLPMVGKQVVELLQRAGRVSG